MEPLTLFSVTVGLIGVIHLFSTTAERLGKGRYDKGNQQAKREDWYCFFQPSDLIGENHATPPKKDNHPTLSDVKRLKQQRQQQVNRPRLQV